MTGKCLIAGALICVAACLVRGEEIVAFSSSAAGALAWQVDGLSVQATNQVLRFTLTRDGAGRATVLPHVANPPRSLLRLFARGPAVLQVNGGAWVTNLAPAGLDSPVDMNLPDGVEGWSLALSLSGSAGATLDLRELLVSGALDMDPPLLLASGRQPAQWTSLGGSEFQPAGVSVRGVLETRERFAFSTNAVAVLRFLSATGRGVQVSGMGWGAAGELLGEARLGEAARPGCYAFDLGRARWPDGTQAVSLRLGPASDASAALLTTLWVGRRP